MEPWDDRGQSIQIGAVILFAALILLLSLYQATVVPQQNEQVEFDHSQQVQSDLLDLRNAVVSTFGESASRAVSIQLGTTYPSRVLAVNPPPVSGSLRTDGTADGDVYFGLANAVALDSETDDFWNGTGPLREYSTGAVVYRPSYNEYGQPPRTVYDSTVLYDNFTFEGATIARSDQTLIDGSTISLVALNGSLRRSSSGSIAVDVRPVSASSTTVAVTNEGAELITIRTATRLPNSTWTELLADESNVTGWETSALTGVDGFRMLEVELKPGTYELRMAKAGVGTRVTDTVAAYMTDVAADGSTVPEEGSVRLTVEVRDRYNNPVSGVNVTGESAVPSAGVLATNETTTGDDGRATFQFEAKSVGAATEIPVEFNFTLDSSPSAFDPDDPEDVEAVVEVQNTQVASSSGGGSAPYTVSWNDPDGIDDGEYVMDVAAQGDDLDLTAVVRNTSLDGKQTIDMAAVDFALNDTAVGNLSRFSTRSDENGEATTTFTAETAGTVRVYAVSGGASDRLDINVTNVAPAISAVSLGNDGSDNLAFSFDSDTQLGTNAGDIRVSVDGPNSGSDWVVFDRTDFDETANAEGTYTYTLTTVQPYDDGSGTYTAVVDDALDSDGNNGGESGVGSGLSDSYSFGGDTDPPSVTSASITNAPINDSDAGTAQTVTVNFDEQMDTDQPLTVEITDLVSSPYSVSGSWVDDTTWTGSVTISDNDEEATATIEVSDGQDTAGNTQSSNPDTSNTFTVDTLSPGDANEVVVEPALIDRSNEGSVDVTVTLPDTVRDDETLVLTLEDDGGDVVTAMRSLSSGEGGQDTTFTVDVSSLSDGTITPTAYVEDDVGNTGGSVTNDPTTKDTQAPVVEDFVVTDNTQGGDVRYEVEYAVSDRTLDSVVIELLEPDGTVEEIEELGASTSGTVTLGDDSGAECRSNPSRPDCADWQVRITVTDGSGLSTERSVTDDPDGSGGSSAATATFSGGEAKVPGRGETSAAQVDVTNGGATEMTIDTVVVASTTSSATGVYEDGTGTGSGQREIYVQADTAGYLEMSGPPYYEENDNCLAVGEVRGLNQTATLGNGNTGYIAVYQFVDDDGNAVDQTGETVELRVEYADGSVETVSFVASDPYA